MTKKELERNELSVIMKRKAGVEGFHARRVRF